MPCTRATLCFSCSAFRCSLVDNQSQRLQSTSVEPQCVDRALRLGYVTARNDPWAQPGQFYTQNYCAPSSSTVSVGVKTIAMLKFQTEIMRRLSRAPCAATLLGLVAFIFYLVGVTSTSWVSYGTAYGTYQCSVTKCCKDSFCFPCMTTIPMLGVNTERCLAPPACFLDFC